MNAEQRAAARALAGKGVQVNDGHTYGVPAADLVAYAETIRALVAELDRVYPVCACVEDVRCAPCMTGAVDPVTGVPTPPADDVREALANAIWNASTGLERAVLDDARLIADAVLASPDVEVRPRGTVTETDMEQLREARAETWDEAVAAVFAWWSAPEEERPVAIVNPYGIGLAGKGTEARS